MSIPLLYDALTLEEKTYLGNLNQHAGYEVLKKLMNAACWKATEEVIKLNPVEEGYERKIVLLQNKARAINEFSASVINSLAFHVRTAADQLSQKSAVDQVLYEKESNP